MSDGERAIRVLIVDDHKVVRVGLREILEAVQGIVVAGEAATASEAVAKARLLQPDVVLLDTRLPDASGLAACRQIKDERPGTRVLVLTSFADDNTILTAVRAGADGYLLKDVDEQELVEGIRRVHRGGAVMAPVAAEVIAGNAGERAAPCGPFEELTGQERRVCELVAEGQSNREVGDTLGLTEKTVRNYLAHAFSKLGVQRRGQLAALFGKRPR